MGVCIVVDKDFYLNKRYLRLLGNSLEYATARLAWQVSLVVSIIFAFSSYNFKTGEIELVPAIVFIVYFIGSFLQYIVCKKIKKDFTKNGKVLSTTMKCGYIFIPFILTGNFLLSNAGFMLIKKEKSIEYCLAVYSFLITFVVIVISLLNLAKEYISNFFFIGIGILLLLALFNIVTILLSSKISPGNLGKFTVPFAIILILSSVTGNLFSFILGIMILFKKFHKNSAASIGWIDVLKRIFRNYVSVVGLFFIVFLMSISICSYLTFDYAYAVENNYSTIQQIPSLQFPFGTDDYGRCLFTRIVFGARISLTVGIISTGIPIIIGCFLGAISGYYGKNVDNVIMRLLDILYATPGILLAIAIIAAFGSNTFNLIMALSVAYIPIYARTMRATVLTISNQEFVEASRACGAKDLRIIFKHIIPNSLAPIIVRATLSIGAAVLSTSALSFLGLGVEPHIPEWGNILKAGSSFLETSPHIAIFPGIAIILIVLAFNYFGDGLRDALDPKLK